MRRRFLARLQGERCAGWPAVPALQTCAIDSLVMARKIGRGGHTEFASSATAETQQLLFRAFA